MKNIVLSYYKLEQFKEVRFDSSFRAEVLEYKTANSHRAVIHIFGDGREFAENDLEQLRKDIKLNLSLSWVGNFAFGLVLHDFKLADDFHYQMVDDWNHSGGACIWAIVVDETIEQASGIHAWSAGTTSNIFEDYLRQYTQPGGMILNRYKTPPKIMLWLDAMHYPWRFFSAATRPWGPKPRFLPPFDLEKPQQKPFDGVVGFGYKMIWFAFKSQEPMRVAEKLGIINPREVDWQTGIDKAYQKSVFITPPIDSWVLAVGWGLSDISQLDEENRKRLETLSREFGEVQFFCTHRIVEAHCWIKAVEGRIVRAYSYIGESGETLLNEGEPTEVERQYQLIDTNSPEAEEDDYWEREDITTPNEELVMKIAESWSIDPTELESREGIPKSGLLAQS